MSNPNIGLEETAAVYLGHAIILYFNSNGNNLTYEDEDWLILNHVI